MIVVFGSVLVASTDDERPKQGLRRWDIQGTASGLIHAPHLTVHSPSPPLPSLPGFVRLSLAMINLTRTDGLL